MTDSRGGISPEMGSVPAPLSLVESAVESSPYTISVKMRASSFSSALAITQRFMEAALDWKDSPDVAISIERAKPEKPVNGDSPA